MGGTLTKAITLPIAGVGFAAIKMGMDFNEGMANVATLIPQSSDRINELKKNVQDMSIATGKSTDDLAGGLYNVISAFGDSAETAKILDINARAAAAGMATTTDAINLTSAVTKGYGDTSTAAVQHVSDLAFQAVKLGQTTFPELAGSIGKVTPLAASLGVSAEDMFAVFATGTGVTGGAAEVSTQFRGILQSLMAPTKDMTALMTDMGYESGVAMLEQEGLQGTINKIVEAANASGQPLQKYIGGIEGQTLAMALAGPQADTFTQKVKAMGEATGLTDEAFKEQTTGVNEAGFAWKQFRNKIVVAAQNLGDTLVPQLTKVFDAMQPVIDAVMSAVAWFANLDSGTQTIILSIVAAVAAIGPLIIGIGFVVSAIGTLIPVFAALLGPVGLVIAIVAALVAGGVLLWKNWDTIKEKSKSIWDSIVGVIRGPVNMILGFANSVISAYEKMLNGVAKAVNAIPSFKIPEWVPGVGGKSFGLPNIPTISLPKIPMLETGTNFVPKDMFAMLHEGEAVVPKKFNTASAGGSIVINILGNISRRDDAEFVANEIVKNLRLQGVMP